MAKSHIPIRIQGDVSSPSPSSPDAGAGKATAPGATGVPAIEAGAALVGTIDTTDGANDPTDAADGPTGAIDVAENDETASAAPTGAVRPAAKIACVFTELSITSRQRSQPSPDNSVARSNCNSVWRFAPGTTA